MNDKRPVNLDISTIEFPIAAIASITHRITGVGLFFGVAILMWLFADSLSGPEGFAAAQACLQSFLGKFLVWGVISLLIYHSLAGVKHLIMDIGIGETLEGGRRGVQMVFAGTAILVVLAGLWIW